MISRSRVGDEVKGVAKMIYRLPKERLFSIDNVSGAKRSQRHMTEELERAERAVGIKLTTKHCRVVVMTRNGTCMSNNE